MNTRYALLVGVAALIYAPPGFAGPCARQIDEAQSQLDAKLGAAAGGGPAAIETTGAKLHHQPTPATVGAAEEKLGDISAESRHAAEIAMARARKADEAGEKARCERDLAEARRAIGEK
jgi:hypothetical protein